MGGAGCVRVGGHERDCGRGVCACCSCASLPPLSLHHPSHLPPTHSAAPRPPPLPPPPPSAHPLYPSSVPSPAAAACMAAAMKGGMGSVVSPMPREMSLASGWASWWARRRRAICARAGVGAGVRGHRCCVCGTHERGAACLLYPPPPHTPLGRGSPPAACPCSCCAARSWCGWLQAGGEGRAGECARAAASAPPPRPPQTLAPAVHAHTHPARVPPRSAPPAPRGSWRACARGGGG